MGVKGCLNYGPLQDIPSPNSPPPCVLLLLARSLNINSTHRLIGGRAAGFQSVIDSKVQEQMNVRLLFFCSFQKNVELQLNKLIHLKNKPHT